MLQNYKSSHSAVESTKNGGKNLQISDTYFEGSCHLIFADFCSCLNLGTFTTPFPIFFMHRRFPRYTTCGCLP